MALLDDLQDPELFRTNMGAKCTVCALVDDLPPVESEQLQALLSNPKVVSAKLAAALSKNGHEVRANTIQRHRRGECRGTRG